MLVNPDDADTRVEVGILDPSGSLGTSTSTGSATVLTIRARSRSVLDLDKLVAGSAATAVRVHATAGRSAAAAYQSATNGQMPGGADWLAPASAPARSVVLTGVPAGWAGLPPSTSPASSTEQRRRSG